MTHKTNNPIESSAPAGARLHLTKENWKMIGQILFMILMLVLGIVFFKHERNEISEVGRVLKEARLDYVWLGLAVTGIYILLQGLMYVWSFRSVDEKVPFGLLTGLFLKRNFLSVFIPSGGVTSLAFFTSDIERRNVPLPKIHLASAIYGFIGILSVVIAAIPGFGYAWLRGEEVSLTEIIGVAALVGMLAGFGWFAASVIRKGWAYRTITRRFPSTTLFLDEIAKEEVRRRDLFTTTLISILIDFCGIIQLYIAMIAFGIEGSMMIATIGYLTATVSLIISPFMRGLGAIEVSMAFVLTKLGMDSVDAIAVTFLYRFFEFWMPLIIGAVSLLRKAHRLLFRIIPTFLLLLLGFINIISVLTPPLHNRLMDLQNLIPMDAINASNNFVLIAGVFMIVIAAFMMKGFKSAWWIALLLCIVSVIGHITKGIDYEEASIALFTTIVLLCSRKEYYIKTDPHFSRLGLGVFVLSLCGILIYGITGFYFLDDDFSLEHSIRQTLRTFFWLENIRFHSMALWAEIFVISIRSCGALAILFLLYTLFKPYVVPSDSDIEQRGAALKLVKKYGKSALDYFKTYPDKRIFLPDGIEAFISYRIALNYAVVLELPVGKDSDEISRCMDMFDLYCSHNGLRVFYYRVPGESLPLFKSKGKKALFIGQEAVTDITRFNLEGGEKKPIRNAINKVVARGYKTRILTPPIKDGDLQRLKSVSDEWLSEMKRKEILFSQGMFLWEELKSQTVITVESPEDKMVGFLNIVPDYAPQESTYDLIRKTGDAPNGLIDFIMIEYFNYARRQGYRSINLGLVPLSGIPEDARLPERSLKFAYEKLHFFAEYHGLREYKEKFDPAWKNAYVIFEHDYDLIQFPLVLNKVIKA